MFCEIGTQQAQVKKELGITKSKSFLHLPLPLMVAACGGLTLRVSARKQYFGSNEAFNAHLAHVNKTIFRSFYRAYNRANVTTDEHHQKHVKHPTLT